MPTSNPSAPLPNLHPATRLLANILSVVFHPILIFLYAFFVLAWAKPFIFRGMSLERVLEESNNQRLLVGIFFIQVFIPCLALGMMRGLGMISDIRLPNREERIAPYIVVGLCYLVGFMQLNSSVIAPNELKSFALGVTIALFIAFFINLFSKISIHAVGMGGLVAMGLYSLLSTDVDKLFILPILVICAGLVGTARRLLGAHEPADIYGGYMIGFFSIFFALRFFIVEASGK
jgi:membrane-associated phospholipid phosphatase